MNSELRWQGSVLVETTSSRRAYWQCHTTSVTVPGSKGKKRFPLMCERVRMYPSRDIRAQEKGVSSIRGKNGRAPAFWPLCRIRLPRGALKGPLDRIGCARLAGLMQFSPSVQAPGLALPVKSAWANECKCTRDASRGWSCASRDAGLSSKSNSDL